MATDALLPSGLSARTGPGATAGRAPAGQRQDIFSKLWQAFIYKTPSFGSRVAESLDYEPVQNDLYFNRVRARRGTRHVYGYGHRYPALPKAVYRLPVQVDRSRA
jgi:hypothetical protein